MVRRVLMMALALGLVTVVVGALVVFPEQRLGLAFTLGTGWGQPALQDQIDALEEQAIANEPFDEADRAFLIDLYRTMATGARVSGIAPQTGRMMDHYLDRSGVAFSLEPEIFTDNRRVSKRMSRLRKRIAASGCAQPVTRKTAPFYMPHASQRDSHYGLYYGTLEVTAEPAAAGRCALSWRAEVPWTWPTYDELVRRHGHPRAERFPLPNLRSLLLGRGHALRVGNGLGAHLAQLGLAKPFVARAEWQESVAF